MAEYMPYLVTEIPVKKTFEFNDTDYSYLVQYNETFDFYSLTVQDKDNNILFSNKLIYRNDALISSRSILPGIGKRIIPIDPDGEVKILNKSSLGKTVFLYIF